MISADLIPIPPEPHENRDIFTVSSLSQALKTHVESQFSLIKIRGEVSGAKLHSSGHLYFSLKDDTAVLAAVSWRGMVSKFPIKIQDGLEIICKGRITTYPLQSKYQMVVESVELAGQGSLLKLLEDRKKKLGAEGLFDLDRKKKLPLLPQVIGIITSPTGAVIQDMLHRLRDRCPASVLIWPVLVQGPEAAEQIVQAIEGFHHFARQGWIEKPDLLIVARGGGSLEDLWAFNEENVVRAVAASEIPVISGVGHEPDVTLIDYVADHRAPTPTAAIERAVPVRSQLLDQLRLLGRRLSLQLVRSWEELTQTLDDRTAKMGRGMDAVVQSKTQRLQVLSARLKHPRDLLELTALRLKTLSNALDYHLKAYVEKKDGTLEQLQSLLKSYSVQQTLDRGFAIVLTEDGHVVSSKAQPRPQEKLTVTIKDGDFAVQVIPSPI